MAIWETIKAKERDNTVFWGWSIVALCVACPPVLGIILTCGFWILLIRATSRLFFGTAESRQLRRQQQAAERAPTARIVPTPTWIDDPGRVIPPPLR